MIFEFVDQKKSIFIHREPDASRRAESSARPAAADPAGNPTEFRSFARRQNSARAAAAAADDLSLALAIKARRRRRQLHSPFDLRSNNPLAQLNHHNTTIMISAIRLESLAKRLAKSVKKQLRRRKSNAASAYETVVSHPHQEELEDNAVNEALEARLAEAIAIQAAASASKELRPAPFTIHLGVVLQSNSPVPSPLLLPPFSAASTSSYPVFNFETNLPMYQTEFQVAQAQAP